MVNKSCFDASPRENHDSVRIIAPSNVLRSQVIEGKNIWLFGFVNLTLKINISPKVLKVDTIGFVSSRAVPTLVFTTSSSSIIGIMMAGPTA